ncbi:MAG: glycyl-radical enzyme activating protein [Clostridiales bacterium]|nr:glycyl-radical enzyme activating protein [Clostridiales bacterium]
MKGTIFNIQPYSLHDGPGIRTIVFLKGCPLRCQWCANPESQLPHPQVYLDGQKCIQDKGCGLCDGACPHAALADGALDHSRCTGCGDCLDLCPAQALGVYGETVEAEAVLDTVERESVFFAYDNGGLTLSGGEPFYQGEFAVALLRGAKRRRIHTAAETCGHCESAILREAAANLDYVLCDLKTMDEAIHRRFTGQSNRLILDNLELLFREYPALPKHIRTPVIPGVNDNEEAISDILRFLAGRKNCTYELLPYHRYGEGKYALLGRSAPRFPKAVNPDRLAALRSLCRQAEASGAIQALI